jgi:nucleoside-diphosphate-sugar epimerase
MSLPTDDQDDGAPRPAEILVTGVPALLARRVAERLLATTTTRVHALCEGERLDEGQRWLAGLPADVRARVTLLAGDVSGMDLGLAGGEIAALTGRLTAIHHTAGLDGAATPRAVTEGTRAVLDLARECQQLDRLCHYSSALVSGRRKGVILEEELDEGQAPRSDQEGARLEAELLVRAAMRRSPITVVRAGLVVGDSRTGEFDRLDGPYALFALLLDNPLDVHLPLIGRGVAPLPLVPIDFVVAAAVALAGDARTAGGTYHLVDPQPFSVRQVTQLVAARAHKKAPRGFIPMTFARALLRTPGLSRLASAPLAFLEGAGDLAFYNSRLATPLLAAHGISCPPLESYLDVLLAALRQRRAKAPRRERPEERDPLD